MNEYGITIGPTLSELRTKRAMQQAQINQQGQQAQLAKLQLQEAEQGQQEKAQLRTLLPQLMQSGDPQGTLKSLMMSGNPQAMEMAGKMAPILAAMQKDTKTTWQDGGDKLVQLDANGQPTGLTMPKGAAPKELVPLEIERIMEAQGVQRGSPQWNNTLRNLQSKLTTHAPGTQVSINGPKETFKNERDLRNDFQGLPTTKAFREVQTAYDQINYALSNPSAASDLAAATKYMKILDPGSVVRESELGMAMEATGKIDRLTNYYNQLKTGQKLTASQRLDFGKLAKGLYDAAAGRYNESATEYQGYAKNYGYNPDMVAKPAQVNTTPTTPGSGQITKAQTSDRLPKPTTLAEGSIVVDNVSGKKMKVTNGKYIVEE